MKYQQIDLPVIDLSPLEDNLTNSSPEVLDQISKDIKLACTKYGAFYITSSSFKLEDQKLILESSRKFFDLSESIKKKIPIKSGGFTRGYVGIGSESGSHRVEIKEAFSYGYEWKEGEKPTNPMQGQNEWGNLEQILGEEWCESLRRYYNQMVHLTELVVNSLEVALGMELKGYCKGGETISVLRLFKYFPYENKEKEESTSEKIGCSPHTVLQPEDTQGLQMFYDNQWWDIPSKPVSFVVNCGDYLSLLTRGAYVYDCKFPEFNQDDDNKALRSKELSLFQDQRADSNNGNENKLDLSEKCFGEATIIGDNNPGPMFALLK
ncbi:1994_t:CDS:2 [Acaulospora colombiana]|uniref:1994_t:CDS:1 n=1 Tax=Acaulospora colombiana TaxID=27376 RepID=A0ACA9LFP5_9GLOM|nr:1994_t:CDS:2 [Acaulospora colombiana]